MNTDKLDFEFLTERGFVPTCRVGAGNTIFNKWGFELDIHCNFTYCKARVKEGEAYQEKYIHTKAELIELEKRLHIDETPIMTQMNVDELKALVPEGYTYTLNKRKKYVKSQSNLSYSKKKGRYKIVKGDEVMCEGYNDEQESYFLCHSLLFVLERENLLPKNKSLQTA